MRDQRPILVHDSVPLCSYPYGDVAVLWVITQSQILHFPSSMRLRHFPLAGCLSDKCFLLVLLNLLHT